MVWDRADFIDFYHYPVGSETVMLGTVMKMMFLVWRNISLDYMEEIRCFSIMLSMHLGYGFAFCD